MPRVAVALWGELRSLCEQPQQEKLVQTLRQQWPTPEPHYFVHCSAHATAADWHAAWRVQSYLTACNAGGVQMLRDRIGDSLLYFNVTPNVVRSGGGRGIRGNTVPAHMVEVYHRQTLLMHEIARAEQHASAHVRMYSHVLSMRADFEVFPAGLALAWRQLNSTRVVHQWDYAYFLHRVHAEMVLGWGGKSRCTHPKYEMCLPDHLAQHHVTPIFIYDLGCVRRGVHGAANRSKTELRGADCFDRTRGMEAWRMSRDDRGSEVWTDDRLATGVWSGKSAHELLTHRTDRDTRETERRSGRAQVTDRA